MKWREQLRAWWLEESQEILNPAKWQYTVKAFKLAKMER